MRSLRLILCVTVMTFAAACSNKTAEQPATTSAPDNTAATQPGGSATAPAGSTAARPNAATATKPGEPAKAAATDASKTASTALPAGTVLTVRLGQTISTKSSRPGEEFAATLAEPIEENGAVLVPQGANAKGVVEESVPKGKFKGASRLRIVLKQIEVNGKMYDVQTASVERAAKGKGKRTATIIGGGAGLGALIGGLAGGGKGAAIGALAGAGAGTAGAAYTGNNDIVLPAESALSFKLLQPVEIKR